MKQDFFLYTKSNCPLCDEFKGNLKESNIEFYVVKIDDDLELMQRYGARVPVLVSGNLVLCEGHFDKQAIKMKSINFNR